MNLVSRCSSVVLFERSASLQLIRAKRQSAVVTAWGIFPGPMTVGLCTATSSPSVYLRSYCDRVVSVVSLFSVYDISILFVLLYRYP